MPTPVATARQCLTEEAAQALDEAVAVARRRGHSQTTSLHMVSSLLSLPSSPLREACSRTRNNAYSTRIQFKALDLCLGVSLDRLSTSPNLVDAPPVSNSLMAAVKRSQANQRRQPENFSFYQQQLMQSAAASSSSNSITVVKVELQNLIVSILDDPIVSRVFSEAGFRSCDIKVGILRPVHQLFKYSSRYRGPMFLCSLGEERGEFGGKVLNFPFLGVSWEENSKRIGEIMVRKKGSRNPLLLGVSGNEALKGFLGIVQRGRGRDVLPLELCGLGVICVEKEILSYISGSCDERSVKLRFQEIDKLVEDCVGNGVLINLGDLKGLGDESVSVDVLRFLVGKLSNLLMIHGVKVWLIGSAVRHEIYLKMLNRFPSIEKDLDLHILPITSLSLPNSMMDVYPKSRLMESFVPLGGFFSVPSDVRSPFLYQNGSRCHLCNEKCEQEINALQKEAIDASVSDQSQASLPIWLQTTCRHPNPSSLDSVQAKDDRFVLSTRIDGLQRKWDSICRSHHGGQLLSKMAFGSGSQSLPTEGLHTVEEMSLNIKDGQRKAPADQNMQSCKSVDLIQDSSVKCFPITGCSDLVSRHNDKSSKAEGDLGSHGSYLMTLSSSSVGNEHASSVTSVTTNLGFETATKEVETLQNGTEEDSLEESFVAANGGAVYLRITNNTSQSSTSACPTYPGRISSQEFKMLYSSLAERISHQQEAVNITCQTIARCRSINEKRQGTSRGDLWLSFQGPDTLGKKSLAVALSEVLYGSKENLVSVDLSFDEPMKRANSLLGIQVLNTYNAASRGKTVVDYIAEKLREQPLSVILLENVDDADNQVQNSLTMAIRTGRFSDSHGREVGISNAIFLTTSKSTKGKQVSSNESTMYSEEDILKKTGHAIQLVIGFDLGDNELNNLPNVSTMDILASVNKRKIIGTSETQEPYGTSDKRSPKASKSFLDLNIPAEESALCPHSVCSPSSKISRKWLDGFLQQVDEEVVFKPVDFDALAQHISMMIQVCCKDTIDAECLLEIDENVMLQFLAAAYFTDMKRVEGWVNDVLRKGFSDAQEKYGFTYRSVVKLVNYEDAHENEARSPRLLPGRIFIK